NEGHRLLGQALDEVRRGQQQARRAELAEPRPVHALDLAAAGNTGERAVHGEAEIRVTARQRECVRLDRIILIEQPERALRAAAHDQAYEADPAGGESLQLPLVEDPPAT